MGSSQESKIRVQMSSLAVTVEEEQRETLKRRLLFLFLSLVCCRGIASTQQLQTLTSAVAAVAAFCNGGRKQRQLISFSCFIELASKPESNNG